ncbi:Hvo_1808 family surface protein [Halobaculum sp. MBLA0143]|uniref:Hvo_1808 family surface protein n=1 Tax=Halobaculum sp. MBLA0143 TaxID=3079933 RepID=UPI0035232048
MRWLVPLFVVALVGVALAPAAAAAPADDATVETADDATVETADDATVETADDVRPDPANDTLGWEDGYWYDDPLPAVDPTDGLNQTELDKVVARSMARVEHIREVEFEKTVPVSLIDRDTFKQRYASGDGGGVPPAYRAFDNAKWEAIFAINESADSIAVANRNRGATVGGFYSPSEDRIVVVSDNTETPQLSEVTLSQELFHALQDQRFGYDALNYATREGHNTADGVVEGDGNYVDSLYSQQCEEEWNCLTDTGGEDSSGGGTSINFGRYFVTFQPYSDGPKYVKAVRERGGWEAVNALYDNPPVSSAAVAEVDLDETQPQTVTIEDQTAGDWQRVEVNGRPSYAKLGQPGVAAMFVRPLYNDANPDTWVVDPRNWLNRTETGELADDPLNYSVSVADGWDGDRLHVYRNADNETGYVWRIAWESEADAREFVDGYRQLLGHYGGDQVGDDTYVIPDSGFADAFQIRRSGDTVTIVNAPTLDDLTQVRTSASSVSTATEATPTPGRTASPTPAVGDSPTPTPTATAGEETATRTPGFGAVVALVALLAAAGLARRRDP